MKSYTHEIKSTKQHLTPALLLILSLVIPMTASAQKQSTMTAGIDRITHKAAVKHDQKTTGGTFYYKAVDKFCISFPGSKDALIMNGKTYTLVRHGKRSVAKGDMQKSFEPLQAVLQAICSHTGNSSVKLKDQTSGITTEHDGTTLKYVITPLADNPKARRRLLFSSFIITVDSRTSTLKSIRMTGRGHDNYTDYLFKDIARGTSIDDSVFK